jgi:exosortase
MTRAVVDRTWFPLLLLSPAWLALAWLVSKAQWFWNHRPDLQFGWIVLLLSGYLLWDGWEQRPAMKLRLTLPAVVAAVLGFGIVFLFQIYQAAFGIMPAALLGLAVGVMLLCASNLLFVFGWSGLRHFGVAFAFLLIALPLPSAIYNPLISGLQHAVATVNVEILKLLGIPAQQIGSLIRLPNGVVGVDEACSGIRSLQSAVMATLFIGYLTLQRPIFQIILLVMGILLATFGNLVRSLTLSYTANAKGLEALKDLHDTAGWSILAFTGAGVVFCSWMLNKLEKQMAQPPPHRSEDRTAPPVGLAEVPK